MKIKSILSKTIAFSAVVLSAIHYLLKRLMLQKIYKLKATQEDF